MRPPVHCALVIGLNVQVPFYQFFLWLPHQHGSNTADDAAVAGGAVNPALGTMNGAFGLSPDTNVGKNTQHRAVGFLPWGFLLFM